MGGMTTNIYNKMKQYRMDCVYEPQLYCYYPFKNIKNVNKIIKEKLYKFNISKDDYSGDLKEIYKIIREYQISLYNKINEIGPKLKCCDITVCKHCNITFTNSHKMFDHL